MVIISNTPTTGSTTHQQPVQQLQAMVIISNTPTTSVV
jgi:hypothetical protein